MAEEIEQNIDDNPEPTDPDGEVGGDLEDGAPEPDENEDIETEETGDDPAAQPDGDPEPEPSQLDTVQQNIATLTEVVEKLASTVQQSGKTKTPPARTAQETRQPIVIPESANEYSQQEVAQSVVDALTAQTDQQVGGLARFAKTYIGLQGSVIVHMLETHPQGAIIKQAIEQVHKTGVSFDQALENAQGKTTIGRIAQLEKENSQLRAGSHKRKNRASSPGRHKPPARSAPKTPTSTAGFMLQEAQKEGLLG